MIIRKVKLDDANNLLSMLMSLDKETKYMLLEPNERDNDVSRVQGMIQQSINGSNLLLVAEEKNTIIGFLSAQRGMLKRIKHTAYIVVGIREAHRGKGIGKKFFSELDLWAKENLISRLELIMSLQNIYMKRMDLR